MVAVIEALAARDRSRTKKQSETLKRHEQQRAEETRLAMAMNSATLQLCVVTANALTGGHNNGNVERAQLAAQEAEEAHNRKTHGMNSMPCLLIRVMQDLSDNVYIAIQPAVPAVI